MRSEPIPADGAAAGTLAIDWQTTVSLVAYVRAEARHAPTDGVFPAFQARWRR